MISPWICPSYLLDTISIMLRHATRCNKVDIAVVAKILSYRQWWLSKLMAISSHGVRVLARYFTQTTQLWIDNQLRHIYTVLYIVSLRIEVASFRLALTLRVRSVTFKVCLIFFLFGSVFTYRFKNVRDLKTEVGNCLNVLSEDTAVRSSSISVLSSGVFWTEGRVGLWNSNVLHTYMYFFNFEYNIWNLQESPAYQCQPAERESNNRISND